MKAYGFRDVQNGILGTLQQVTGIGYSGVIYKIQWGNAHNIAKNPAEMSGAPVAEIRQMFHGKLLAVILLDIVEGGSNGQGIALFLLFFTVGRGLRPHKAGIGLCGVGGVNLFFCTVGDEKALASSMYRDSKSPFVLI